MAARRPNSIQKSREGFFSTINGTLNPRGSKSREKREAIHARRMEKIEGYLSEIESGIKADKTMTPAQLVQQTLLLVCTCQAVKEDGGEAVDPIALVKGCAGTPFAKRVDWAKSGSQILGWAQEVGAEIGTVRVIFGLKDETIVPAKPAAPKPRKPRAVDPEKAKAKAAKAAAAEKEKAAKAAAKAAKAKAKK